MAATPRDCPCFSGERYTACCAPYHRGEREPPSCVRLMRSRYAAFALGLGAYLVRTLAADHEQLDLPRDALLLELSHARERQRFLGLRILYEAESGDEGEVMFFARIFEKGADRSFAELSRFVRQGDAWRYAAGVMVQKSDLPGDLETLTPEDMRRTAR